jgi:hypothetical protein
VCASPAPAPAHFSHFSLHPNMTWTRPL